MAQTVVRTIQANHNGRRIPIPRHICEALAWRHGDVLAFTINTDASVTLTKIAVPELYRAVEAAHP